MTKSALLKMVRAEFETQPVNVQGLAAVRAIGVSIFAWDMQSTDALLRLWGAIRVVAMMTTEAA